MNLNSPQESPAKQEEQPKDSTPAKKSNRIPDEEIELIKREVDLATVVRASGVELVRKGKDFFGLCPFHKEKTPSFCVSPNNFWRCFGACDEGGSVM